MGILLCAISFVEDSTLGATDPINVRETLKGLHAVAVLLKAEETCRQGLNDRLLRTNIELQLRQAGIRVLDTREEPVVEPALLVDVWCYRVESREVDVVAFAFQARRRRRVFWPNPHTEILATTWHSDNVIGTSPKSGLGEFLSSSVRNVINQFINDWLAVNPTK